MKGFTTTEIDKKKGFTKFPPANFRNTDNDLLKEEYTADDYGANPLEYDEGKALRDQQYAATKDYNKNAEEEDPDEEDEV